MLLMEWNAFVCYGHVVIEFLGLELVNNTCMWCLIGTFISTCFMWNKMWIKKVCTNFLLNLVVLDGIVKKEESFLTFDGICYL